MKLVNTFAVRGPLTGRDLWRFASKGSRNLWRWVGRFLTVRRSGLIFVILINQALHKYRICLCVEPWNSKGLRERNTWHIPFVTMFCTYTIWDFNIDDENWQSRFTCSLPLSFKKNKIKIRAGSTLMFLKNINQRSNGPVSINYPFWKKIFTWFYCRKANKCPYPRH